MTHTKLLVWICRFFLIVKTVLSREHLFAFSGGLLEVWRDSYQVVWIRDMTSKELVGSQNSHMSHTQLTHKRPLQRCSQELTQNSHRTHICLTPNSHISVHCNGGLVMSLEYLSLKRVMSRLSWWVLQHCTGFARLVWGRLRVHRAFVYSDWFVCYVCFCSLYIGFRV